MTFKGAQRGGPQKRYVYHICIFNHQRIWASQTIGLISMCKSHEIFCEKVITCTVYSTIFNMPYITGFIYLLCSCFPGAKFLSRSSLCDKVSGWSDLGVRTVTKLFSQYSVLYEFSVE